MKPSQSDLQILTSIHSSLTTELCMSRQEVSRSFFAYITLYASLTLGIVYLDFSIISARAFCALLLTIGTLAFISLNRQIKSYNEVACSLPRVEKALGAFEHGRFIPHTNLLDAEWEKYASGSTPNHFLGMLAIWPLVVDMHIICLFFGR